MVFAAVDAFPHENSGAARDGLEYQSNFGLRFDSLADVQHFMSAVTVLQIRAHTGKLGHLDVTHDFLRRDSDHRHHVASADSAITSPLAVGCVP